MSPAGLLDGKGPVMVRTFQVVRRQFLGVVDGRRRFRENGELIPEAHLWRAPEHALHTGELTDVEVSDEDFQAAVEQFVEDPAAAEQILESVGLGEVPTSMVDPGIGDVPLATRRAPMLPQVVPEVANERTLATQARPPRRNRVASSRSRGESTIMATGTPGGVPTGRAPRSAAMVLNQPREGAKGVYEDAQTVDPHELNEALTGTRPEDIERAEEALAAAQSPGRASDPGAGVAPGPVSAPVGVDTQTGSVATVPATPSTFEGNTVEGEPAEPGSDPAASTASTPATATTLGAPTLTDPTDGATVTAGTVQVSGTTDVDGTIEIYDGDVTLGSGSSSGGQFSVPVSLAAGDHELAACVNANGQTSEWSDPVSVTAE